MRLFELLDGDELATTDVVIMEVLAGARDERERNVLERLLDRHPRVAVASDDYETAASIYRTCRRHGHTPRSLLDCVVAAVAMRVGASVLHHDRDFDVMARHVGLAIDRP